MTAEDQKAFCCLSGSEEILFPTIWIGNQTQMAGVEHHQLGFGGVDGQAERCGAFGQLGEGRIEKIEFMRLLRLAASNVKENFRIISDLI